MIDVEHRLLEIGTRIRVKRESKFKSQRSLGMDIGATPSKISRIERGKAPNVSFRDLLRIADSLGMKEGDLFGTEAEVFVEMCAKEKAYLFRVLEFARKEFDRRKPSGGKN